MLYSIFIKKSALKALKSFPKEIKNKIEDKIDTLEHTPRPQGSKKLKNSQNLYRIREGNYRIIYQIKDEILTILIVVIGMRKDIYEKLKKNILNSL